ncbi:MAG TPA: OmpA family protein [Terriglobales bacterium]|nr:OmpA family protein [Terriglobales bacterium]
MSFTRCARGLIVGFMLAGFSALLPIAMQAQNETAPKADLFVGYQWLDPNGKVPVPGTANPVQGQKLQSMPEGFGLAFGYNFHPNFALEGDYGGNWSKDGLNFNTYSLGPRFTWRTDTVNYFLHTLLSLNQLNTPFSADKGVGAILGGGLDLKVHKYFSIRLIEADYQWGHHRFSNLVPDDQPDLKRPSFNGTRLRTGVVFNFGGGAPEVPPSATCSAQPTEVMVGEPITVTATPSNFNPKHTVSYNWTSTGGKITGKDNTASIDTNGVAGGSYTATARITDAKAKKNNEASCTANFTVKEPPKNPPTMSCSANPQSLQAGGSVTVTCDCKSPDNVQVNVAGWNASGGSVSGTGNTATLNTTGASTGPVTVSATCTDSRGLTGSASTQVTVEAPQPSPEIKQLEARLGLGRSVYFPTAQPTPKDPKGGLVPSQQKTLLELATDFSKYLQAKPDAHLILEGHADPRGGAAYNQKLSERRTDRVKSFLVENGVPADHIDTQALGDQHNLTPEEVKTSVEQNSDLTPSERTRIMRNMRTIILASNRRVDIRLSTTGQTSARQFPFNATDSLTLIGGREAERAKAKKAPARKTTKKKPAKSQ